MEPLPGWQFPNINLSPIRDPSCSMSLTPQTVSPSSQGSVPIMMEEKNVSYDSDEASISLDELMSHPVTALHKQQGADESSTACIASPDCSRDSLDTSNAIILEPHDKRAIKLRQKQQTRTDRFQKEAPTLEDYLQKTRPPHDVSNCLDESNATLFGGLNRSRSQNSLPTMEKESVTGRKFVRRRSNSFSHHHHDDSQQQQHPTDTVFHDITRMRLQEEDVDSIAPPKRLPIKPYCDSIEDGCKDEDSYMRRARGRRLSKQQSVRDPRTGKNNKRDTERRRNTLRKQHSAHQLKKADDFLQATDADSLKDLVDSWKEERNEEISGTMRRHLTTIRGDKTDTSKPKKSDLPGHRTRATLRGIIGSQEPSFSGESASSGLVSTEVSETSLLSSNSSSFMRGSLRHLKKATDHECSDPNLSFIKQVKEEDKSRMTLEAGSSTHSNGVDCVDECTHASDVILQFDANQKDHINRVHLDHTGGYLLRIDCADGPTMEGIVCRMPVSEEHVERTAAPSQNKHDTNETSRVVASTENKARTASSGPQMLWRGPSSFFLRRPKAQGRPGAHTNPDDKAVLFDDLGRLIEE